MTWECRIRFLAGFFSFVLGNSFPSFSLRQDVCYLFVLPAIVGRRCVECGLTFYSCVSEVDDDGNVLEGAELEVPVAQRASLLQPPFQSGHVPPLICLALMTRLLSKPFLSFKSFTGPST